MRLFEILENAVAVAVRKLFSDILRVRVVNQWVGLQALEGRALFAVTVHEATWAPGVANTLWSTSGNWSYPTGDPSNYDANPVAPQNTATDVFNVKINISSPPPTLADNATISNLTIDGSPSLNRSTAINFVGSNTTLDVHADVDLNDGNVNMNIAANHSISLSLGADGTNSGTILAKNFAVTGNTSGWANLTVDDHVALRLSRLEALHNVFNLTVSGTLSGFGIFLLGEDWSGSGAADPSIVTVSGNIEATHSLWIGGQGQVDFTANDGAVSAKELRIVNLSSFKLANSSSLAMGEGSTIHIGNSSPAAYMPVAAPLLNTTGATFIVGTDSFASTAATIKIGGGDGIKMIVNSGGVLTADTINVYAGSPFKNGPQIIVTLGDITVQHDFNIGEGDVDSRCGQLIVTDHSNINVSGVLGIGAGTLESYYLLDAKSSSQVVAGSIYLGIAPYSMIPAAYGVFRVTDDSSIFAFDNVVVGSGIPIVEIEGIRSRVAMGLSSREAVQVGCFKRCNVLSQHVLGHRALI